MGNAEVLALGTGSDHAIGGPLDWQIFFAGKNPHPHAGLFDCAAGASFGRTLMRTRYVVVLSMLAGAALGAGAIQGLHAQATPPVYVVAEIDVSNVEGYTKEYVPKAQALIKRMGGTFLAAGQKVTSLEGDPPKARVGVTKWESMEKIRAWRASPEYKDTRQIGDKYAKFRVFAVEGLPQ
jgi:uncharacterized protein (DUF1330 family)